MKTVSLKITIYDDKNVKYSDSILPGSEKGLNVHAITEKLKELKQKGIQKVIFTGGEPFLFQDTLFQIIKFAKNLGFIVAVTTNGSRINDFNSHILNFVGVDEVNLKIDSMSGVTNIAIGNFISDLDEIDYYDVINKLKSKNIKVNIHTVVNKFNQHEELHDIVNFTSPGYWLIEEVDPNICTNYQYIKADNNNYEHFISKHPYPFVKRNLELEDKIKF